MMVLSTAALEGARLLPCYEEILTLIGAHPGAVPPVGSMGGLSLKVAPQQQVQPAVASYTVEALPAARAIGQKAARSPSLVHHMEDEEQGRAKMAAIAAREAAPAASAVPVASEAAEPALDAQHPALPSGHFGSMMMMAGQHAHAHAQTYHPQYDPSAGSIQAEGKGLDQPAPAQMHEPDDFEMQVGAAAPMLALNRLEVPSAAGGDAAAGVQGEGHGVAPAASAHLQAQGVSAPAPTEADARMQAEEVQDASSMLEDSTGCVSTESGCALEGGPAPLTSGSGTGARGIITSEQGKARPFAAAQGQGSGDWQAVSVDEADTLL
jgi:hypothetical protein